MVFFRRCSFSKFSASLTRTFSKSPDASAALMRETYTGKNTFGYLASPAEKGFPSSISATIPSITSIMEVFSVCSFNIRNASISVSPEVRTEASCLVKNTTSANFGLIAYAWIFAKPPSLSRAILTGYRFLLRKYTAA